MDKQELYTLHPEIEQIVDRLKLGERKALERKSLIKRNHNEANTYIPKKNPRLICEHGVVASWIINGKTIANPGLLLRGKDFEESLEKIIEKNPSKIKLMIYAGSTTDSQVKLRQDFILKEDASNTIALPEPIVESTINDVSNKQLSGVEKELQAMRAEFTEMKNRPAPENIQNADAITKLQLDMAYRETQFETRLAQLTHAAEIDKLKHEHQREVDALQAQIEDLEDEIDELMLDLTESENQLSGLEKIVNKPKEEGLTTTVLLGLAEKIVVGVVKNHVNPKVAKQVLGLTDEQYANFFVKEGELNLPQKTTDNTGFSAATEADYFEGLDEAFAKSLKFFLEYFKTMGFENFKILGTVIAETMNEDGSLDVEKTKKLFQFIKTEQ